LEKFDADHAQQVPKPPAPKPGVPPGDLPPVPDPAPPPIENPGDAPLSPITDPDVIEPGEPNPALHANAGSWRKAKSGTFRCKLIHV